MAEKKIHWAYYTFGFTASLIIGIDCAINAAFYMTLMGGFYAVPIVIIFCALAGMILNTILYANDLPEALDTLENNIQDGVSILDPNENPTNKGNTLYQISFNLLKEFIAISSGIVMGLFTYDAYLAMSLPFVGPYIIIIFCLAYVLGTYALVRTSLNPEYADKSNIYQKMNKLSTTTKIITSIIIAIMLLATYWTLITCFSGAMSAAILISPMLAPIIPVLFVMLLAGEAVFVIKTAIWLGEKIQDTFSQQNKIKSSNILRDIFYYLCITFNAIANGAIAAASSTKIAAAFGSILSFGVMFKSVNEIDIEAPDIKENEKLKMQKAMWYTAAIVTIGISVWACINFVAPALASVGIINPLTTALALLTATICIILLVINLVHKPKITTEEMRIIKNDEKVTSRALGTLGDIGLTPHKDAKSGVTKSINKIA